MAITVDDTTVARVSNGGGTSAITVTTGSFNVAAGQCIVIAANWDQATDGTADSLTISDNQTPDLVWVAGPIRGASESGAGAARMWYFHHATGLTGLTVTLTGNTNNNYNPTVKTYLLTDHDSADPLGAVNEGTLSTDPQTTTNITSETAGVFFAQWTDWGQTGTPTSSDLTLSTFNFATFVSGASGYKQIASAGATVNGNMNSGGTPVGNWICYEMRASASAAVVPPPRPVIPRHAVTRAATI